MCLQQFCSTTNLSERWQKCGTPGNFTKQLHTHEYGKWAQQVSEHSYLNRRLLTNPWPCVKKTPPNKLQLFTWERGQLSVLSNTRMNDRTAEQQNSQTAEWPNDRMAEWQNDWTAEAATCSLENVLNFLCRVMRMNDRMAKQQSSDVQ